MAETSSRTVLYVAAATCVVAIITLAVLISAVYYGREELRAVDVRSKLASTRVLVAEFDSRGMRTLRATVAADLMNHRPLKPNEAEAILDYFETVGELAHKQVLDDEMLWNQLSLQIRCYWAGRSGYGLSGYVQKKRSATGDPTWYERAQWLDGAMALQESRHRGIPVAETLLGEDRIRECLTGETNLEHVLQSPRR